MIANLFGKVVNDLGEIVAEGACEVDEVHGSVTLRPIYDMPLLARQHGLLRLTLDDGTELTLSDRVLRFRINLPDSPPGFVYKLYIQGQQSAARWRYADEQQGSEPGSPRDPDRLPPDLHKDPPPPELRR